MIIHAKRLLPGEDLKQSIQKFVDDKNIQAGVVLSSVGSLSKAKLRLAEEQIVSRNEYFEIVSMAGTVSKNGSHIHISLSDKNGETIGGHLKDECIVHTTAEIVIGELETMVFNREADKRTGFNELVVEENRP